MSQVCHYFPNLFVGIASSSYNAADGNFDDILKIPSIHQPLGGCLIQGRAFLAHFWTGALNLLNNLFMALLVGMECLPGVRSNDTISCNTRLRLELNDSLLSVLAIYSI